MSNSYPGFVIFCDFGGHILQSRRTGQALPAGSIPLYAEQEDKANNFVGLFLGGCSSDWPYDGSRDLANMISDCRFEIAVEIDGEIKSEDLAYLATSSKARENISWSIGHGNLRVIEMLVNAGADVNTVDERGQTPLDEALDSEEWFSQNYPRTGSQVVSFLREHGAKRAIELIA